MIESAQQLTLNLNLPDEATFNNYIAGDNHNTIMTLQQAISQPGNTMQFIYLWGSNRVGRTHLLQAACHELANNNEPSAYLPLKLHNELNVGMLEGLEKLSLVCLDDIHLIRGNIIWEEALFHLFNRLLTTNSRLLVTANTSPSQLSLSLPDLQSRLTSGVICQLHDLSDQHKCEILMLRAKLRGMPLSQEIAQFLVRRLSRDTAALISVLDQLDQASLTAKHRLTLPFVKAALGL